MTKSPCARSRTRRLLPPRLFVLALAGLAGTGLLGPRPARAQQVHRNSFEGREPVWVKGGADAPFRENAHEMADVAHGGQHSEYLKITAEPGAYVYYQYPIGRVLLNEELSASVWVKGSRPGIMLLARLVLPHERNPNNLDDHLTALVRGDVLKAAGRWQRLEIRRPVALAREQQQLMQASLKRPVDFKDAYIDALVLNVYPGPGLTEVWIDDLEAGPVLDPVPPFKTIAQPAGPKAAATASQTKPGRPVLVEHNQDNLLVGGKRFLIRGIRYTNTSPGVLKTLRDAGFNTLFIDFNTPPNVLQEAVDLGFWLVPSLPETATDPHLVANDNLAQAISRFPAGDAVLMWYEGGALTYEQTPALMKTTQQVRTADPGRPVGGDVWDGFLPYSRNLDLLGVHRWPLMTTLEFQKYREWLNQRRLLANPGTFTWTWVQTHLPDWYVGLVYGTNAEAGFSEPVGPQPEQIRLLAYTALAAGCRGLGFWSDRFLADSHQGRDRLQLLALLNQELEMLEPLFLTVNDPPLWIDTSVPEVKAAVLRSPRGILVLPMWLGNGAQFVPGQSAAARLTLVVPQVPQGTQAWQVSPGAMRGLRADRVAGGYKIVLPEFGLTDAVVFTSDMALVVRFQEQVRAKRKLAAQWTRDLAQLEMAKVQRVEQELERAGHTLPDGAELMKDAHKRLAACDEDWTNHLYDQAYVDAQRALRPMRIMMRAQWEKAVHDLDTPVASPYAVSFYTLPRHWALMDQIKQLGPGVNLIPEGNFELPLTQTMPGWRRQDLTLDAVELNARRVTEVLVEIPRPKVPGTPAPKTGLGTSASAPKPPAAPAAAAASAPIQVSEKPKEGLQCLMLEIRPKNPLAPPAALQRTFLGVHTPAVKLQPGSLVKISAWVRIPRAITASADGALLYDSAGGEPFAIRLTDVLPWKQFTLYRKVPPSGEIGVTLALTGIGRVYFDDIHIEPLTEAARAAAVSAVAAR